jgi:hypothetical protein
MARYCLRYAGTDTRTLRRNAGAEMKILHKDALRRRKQIVTAVALVSYLRPGGRCTGYSSDIRAPRPMRSRVTMAGSRFPGSRVIAFDHLPRGPSGAPVVRLVVGYPPTVAGAAAELPTEVDAPHSLE